MTEQRDSGCNRTPLYNGNSGIIMMAIVAVAYGVLNFLTPLYHDDFVYKFMFEGGAVNYDHPIRSIGDIIASQVDHYTSVNGRSIVHFLVQLFTGLLGKTVFNLFNVIVFCTFIYLLKRQSIGGKRLEGDARFCVSTLVILVLVLLMPRFKDTFLWMTGSINYLWSATAALGFLLIYEKRREQAMDWSLLPMLLVAFLLGWTHEGITLPLAASLVLINLFSLKQSHGREQGLWLALAYLAGGCVIALAPGTIARSGMGGGLTPSILGLKVITGGRRLDALDFGTKGHHGLCRAGKTQNHLSRSARHGDCLVHTSRRRQAGLEAKQLPDTGHVLVAGHRLHLGTGVLAHSLRTGTVCHDLPVVPAGRVVGRSL